MSRLEWMRGPQNADEGKADDAAGWGGKERKKSVKDGTFHFDMDIFDMGNVAQTLVHISAYKVKYF